MTKSYVLCKSAKVKYFILNFLGQYFPNTRLICHAAEGTGVWWVTPASPFAAFVVITHRSLLRSYYRQLAEVAISPTPKPSSAGSYRPRSAVGGLHCQCRLMVVGGSPDITVSLCDPMTPHEPGNVPGLQRRVR